jgi:hypothetical protein
MYVVGGSTLDERDEGSMREWTVAAAAPVRELRLYGCYMNFMIGDGDGAGREVYARLAGIKATCDPDGVSSRRPDAASRSMQAALAAERLVADS